MPANDLLNRFTAAPDARSQRDALTALVKNKQLHRVANEEPFRKGLANLARIVRVSECGAQRLLGVAVLERAAAVAKLLRRQVELVFKRFKSLAQLGHVPKYDDDSAKAWLYGKLFAALLVEKLIHHARTISPWGYTAPVPAPPQRV